DNHAVFETSRFSIYTIADSANPDGGVSEISDGCVASCTGKSCGESDGCSGTCAGPGCSAGQMCMFSGNSYACVPVTSTSCTSGEDRSCYPGPAGTLGIGVCMDGIQTCTADSTWGPCSGAITPTAETCDGLDNDCNGQVDELASCHSCTPNCAG